MYKVVMVELYIEYVLIDNFVVDYILLKFIEKTLGVKIYRIRFALFLILGVISALFLPYLYFDSGLMFLYRIFVSIILTLCIKKYKNFNM